LMIVLIQVLMIVLIQDYCCFHQSLSFDLSN
jgi:hypothetical protein